MNYIKYYFQYAYLKLVVFLEEGILETFNSENVGLDAVSGRELQPLSFVVASARV